MKELQEDIKQLRSVLAKDSRKYLEMKTTNNREGRVLQLRMEEIRKTLEVLNPSNTIELYDYRKDHEAFINYIKDQQNKHGISLSSLDNTDFDHVDAECRRYGFSDKMINGTVFVQLVEFYIKNNGST